MFNRTMFGLKLCKDSKSAENYIRVAITIIFVVIIVIAAINSIMKLLILHAFNHLTNN